MLFAKTSFRRVSDLITSQFTSSDASDFPKCGCKGTNKRAKNQEKLHFFCFFERKYFRAKLKGRNILYKNQIFPKKVVPLQPNL